MTDRVQPALDQRTSGVDSLLGRVNRLPGFRQINDLSIGDKLTIGFGMLVGLTLLVAGLSFLGSRGAIKDINTTTAVRAPITLASSRAQVSLLRMQTDVLRYLALGDHQYSDDYAAARQAFQANLGELETLLSNGAAEDLHQLEELKATFQSWSAFPERLFEAGAPSTGSQVAEGERTRDDVTMFRTQAEPQAEHMRQLLQELTTLQQAQLQADLDRDGRELSSAQVHTLVGGLLAFLVGIGMALLSRANIVGPIRRLTDTTRQITAGDLSAQASVEWEDEIGQLAMATNIMTGRLRETIDGLARRTHQLEALRHASLGLTSHLKLQAVLEAILEGCLQLVSEAHNAYIFLYQAEQVTLGAALTPDTDQAPLTTGARADGLVYSVAQAGQPIVLPDTRVGPRYTDVARDWEGTILALPLQTGGRTVGVMAICKQPPSGWPEAELRVLGLLADQAAIAVENARLYEQAQQEIAERERAEAELRRYRDYLEELVAERTAALQATNQQLSQQITERVRAESHRDATLEALRQSEERYRAVSELTSDYADALRVEVNGSLTREWVTGAFTRITGFRPEELPAQDGWKRIVHPDDSSIFERRLQNLLAGRPDVSQYRIITKNGEVRWLRAHGRPIWDDSQSRIVRYIGAAQDITEQVQAEQQLERYAARLAHSNEELKHFTYIVSHDLRAPLVNLKGFATELRFAVQSAASAIQAALPYLDEAQQQQVRLALEEDIPEALGFIDSSASRMDRFINALLQLSRLGRRQLDLELIDMQSVVEMTLETLAHQIEERAVQVSLGALPEVVADRTSMEQIIGNILDNAIKYLDPERSGVIDISAERDAAETTFRIHDNGRGIAQEDMNKVFAPFRRAGRQDVPGEGMGLSYVQTLVRLHGGRIWCESKPDEGTTFVFTIPHHLK
jgi:PAS domain S-box-containing protein